MGTMACRRRLTAAALTLLLLGGCGGGGGGAVDATTAPPPSQPAGTTYPRSLVLGVAGSRPLTYREALPGSAPTVLSPVAGQFFVAGVNHVIAEFRPSMLEGARMACVSGRGESIGTLRPINLGVLAVGAAILFDDTWSEVDPEIAWGSSGPGVLVGWENCGVKAEGAQSPSSRLTPRGDGGYEEDVYDGNPGTNFNILRVSVSAAAAKAMRSPNGGRSVDDPSRPLVLTWRAYQSNPGKTVFVLRGDPDTSGPAGTQGFIALYVSGS
jgi:hypothetical protein